MDPIAFGGVKSPADYRDIKLVAVLGTPKQLPSEFFVDIKKLPVWSQGAIGSCTGHAGAKYRQKHEEDETNEVINLSPRWLYAMAKCQDGYPHEGTYPRLIMQIAKNYGCATENTVKNITNISHEEYVYDRKVEKIPKQAFEEAKKYKIKSYAIVGVSKDELKQAIVEAKGCMLLVRLGQEWWTDKAGNYSRQSSALFPLRPPKTIVSGHEIYLYGYKDVGDGSNYTKFYFLNSWGESWGERGTGNFIYEDYKNFIDEAITAFDLPNNLLEEVHNLPSPKEFRHNFLYDMSFGQKNDEVKNLQIALKIDGCFPEKQEETGYYGVVTQEAVKKFQKKYKVASLLELTIVNGKKVGPKTRAKLTSLFNK